ncbi:MAG: ABC transporter ATP-binding protein [Planctomycetota bacterium]
MSSAIIDVRDLRMRYRKGLFGKGFEALRGVSIAVEPGSVFGLLGPNGAGKTTLIKVLLGLTTHFKGEASLFGERAGRPSSRWKVGYLPEAHRLPPYLTGRQVLELFGGLCGRSRSWLEARIPAMLDAVGMTDAAHRKIKEYSKGMQQRIGLAQALIHEPELVFLDEPTDGVDPVGRAQIRDVIAKLKAQGVTVFINSHLLMEVEQMCDRIVIIDKGQVLREGTIEELTPSTGLVTFDLGAGSERARSIVAPLVESLDEKERALVCRMDTERTDAVIDALRAGGVSIRAVRPERLSLEASFIDLVVAQSKQEAKR